MQTAACRSMFNTRLKRIRCDCTCSDSGMPACSVSCFHCTSLNDTFMPASACMEVTRLSLSRSQAWLLSGYARHQALRHLHLLLRGNKEGVCMQDAASKDFLERVFVPKASSAGTTPTSVNLL